MIPRSKVDAALALLRQGLTERSVARILGLGRDTVSLIACDGWTGFRRSKPSAARNEPDGPTKCPTCGHTIEMPCRVCAARRLAALNRRNRRETYEDIKIDLKPDQQARYEELRCRIRPAGCEECAEDD